MASKWMKKLGIGMSAIMTVSQLSGMVAMAAPEDDNNTDDVEFVDVLEDKFEEEYTEEDVEVCEKIEEFYLDENADLLSDENDTFETDGDDSEDIYKITDNDTLWKYIKMDPPSPGILMADVELSDTAIIKDRVLDLNSHTWNITWFLSISAPNSFRVIDSSEAKTGKVSGQIIMMAGPYAADRTSTLTLESGTIETIKIAKGGSVYLEGGRIEKEISLEGGKLSLDENSGIDGDVNISGGELDFIGGEIKGNFIVSDSERDIYINADIESINKCSSVSLSGGYYTANKADIERFVVNGYEVEEVSIQYNGKTYNSHIKPIVEEWLEDYDYRLDDYSKRVYITNSKGTIDSKKIVIPASAEIKGTQYQVVLDPTDLRYKQIEGSLWSADKEIEEIVIEKGVIIANGSNLFRNMYNLKKLDVSGLDTTYACYMDGMFYGCSELESLDVFGFDTSNVYTMSGMFYGCSRLENLDVSGFNMANVHTTDEMFYGCKMLKNIDLSNFNTSNATDIHSMFEECESLTELDLSSFDTQKVTDCSSLFKNCTSLKKVDLSSFQMNYVTKLEDIFTNCSSLEMLKVPLSIPYNSEIILPDIFYDSTGKSYTKLEGSDIVKSYWIGKEGVSVPEKPEVMPQSIGLSRYTLNLEAGQSEELSFWIYPEVSTNQNVIWSSSDNQVANVSEAGKVIAIGAGTAEITVATEANGLSATCEVTVIQMTGEEFRQDEQGIFCYYVDGIFQKDTSGFVDWDGSKFFLVNGKVDSSANGLVNDINHLEDWYYCAVGQVQTQYTGLAQYDGKWFYINKGKLDTTLADYVEYDGGLFFVGAGRIMTEVNGLAKDPDGSDWYYLANGQAQIQYTGLAQYDGEWFYVVKGKLAENYTGPVNYDGSIFDVKNGMVITPTLTITEDGFIVFGSYEQDGNLSNGPEPIEWEILEDDGSRLFLVSRYVLDAQPYNVKDVNVDWENCTLRSWLNCFC